MVLLLKPVWFYVILEVPKKTLSKETRFTSKFNKFENGV